MNPPWEEVDPEKSQKVGCIFNKVADFFCIQHTKCCFRGAFCTRMDFLIINSGKGQNVFMPVGWLVCLFVCLLARLL